MNRDLNTPHALDVEEMLNQRDFKEFESTQLQKQKDFFNLHVKVRDHMGWDDVKTKNWFYSQNPQIGNFTPLDYYGKRPEKCVRWINNLIDEGSEV